MSLSDLILMLTLPVLLAACAACASAETALFSLTQGDRVRMRRQAPRIADVVARLVAKPRSLIISLLLANSASIASYLAVGGVLAKAIHNEWLGIVAALSVPFVLIVFGEVLPKALAGMHPYRAAIILAIPVLVWDRLVSPVRVFLDEYAVAPLARVFRPAGASEHHPLTVDELDELLTASHPGGALDEKEQRLLAEVVGLGSMRVRDLMTPRVDIVWVHAGASFADVIAFLRESGQTRFPVSRGADGDGVLGFLDTHAYLAAAERSGTSISVANFIDPVRYVPERARADALIEHFRQTRSHTALVVDERGGVVGLVDIEDAVMPLVRATSSTTAITGGVKKLGRNQWLVGGRVSVRDWADLIGEEFAWANNRVSTLGGLVQMRLGRLAHVGDEVKLATLRIKVESMDERAIDTLLVTLDGGTP